MENRFWCLAIFPSKTLCPTCRQSVMCISTKWSYLVVKLPTSSFWNSACKANSWKKYQLVMYSIVLGAGKVVVVTAFICADDTCGIDTWDKQVVISSNRSGQKKFTVPSGGRNGKLFMGICLDQLGWSSYWFPPEGVVLFSYLPFCFSFIVWLLWVWTSSSVKHKGSL